MISSYFRQSATSIVADKLLKYFWISFRIRGEIRLQNFILRYRYTGLQPHSADSGLRAMQSIYVLYTLPPTAPTNNLLIQYSTIQQF
jgi:hypothetical protein